MMIIIWALRLLLLFLLVQFAVRLLLFLLAPESKGNNQEDQSGVQQIIQEEGVIYLHWKAVIKIEQDGHWIMKNPPCDWISHGTGRHFYCFTPPGSRQELDGLWQQDSREEWVLVYDRVGYPPRMPRRGSRRNGAKLRCGDGGGPRRCGSRYNEATTETLKNATFCAPFDDRKLN